MNKLKINGLRKVATIATFLGIQSDKLLHMICAGILTLILSLILSTLVSVIAVSSICILKEIFDCFKTNPTGFSFADLVWDLIGILLFI